MSVDATGTRFVIGDRELAEISTYCEIARENRSLLTLGELAQLTSVDATEEEFEAAWRFNSQLRSRFSLEGGYVIGEDMGAVRADKVDVENENRATARRNVSIASEFADLCADPRVRLVAVAGGNSYRSARRGDDIDFFCVTARDSLWLFMLKALLLARLYSAARRTPPFCFSYVIDEEKARTEFGEPKDALFARDALSARVLIGAGFYRELVLEGSWMQRYFPRLYGRRVVEESGDAKAPLRSAEPGSRVLNEFLFWTVGSYVRVKAMLLNRRYRKNGDASGVFHARIGRDHCVYESNRYRRLRRMYTPLDGVDSMKR